MSTKILKLGRSLHVDYNGKITLTYSYILKLSDPICRAQIYEVPKYTWVGSGNYLGKELSVRQGKETAPLD